MDRQMMYNGQGQQQDLNNFYNLSQTNSNRNSTDYQAGLSKLLNSNDKMNYQTTGHPMNNLNPLTAKSYIQELKQTHDGYSTQVTQQETTNYTNVNIEQSVEHRGTPQNIQHNQQPLKVVRREEVDAGWRQTCSQLEKQVNELQHELSKYRGTNQTFDKVTYIEDTGRVNSLVSENDRLNRVIIDLNNEIKMWNQKYNSLQQNMGAKQSLDIEVDRMKKVLQDNENILQSEIIRLREIVSFEQTRSNKLENEIVSLKSNEYKYVGYEQFLINLQSEVNQQQVQFQQKDEENQKLMKSIRSYENQFLQQNEELKKLVRMILDERNREIDTLKKQKQHPESPRSKQLQEELQRLSLLMRNKDEEIVRFKQTQVRLQSQDGTNVHILRTENQRLNDRVSQLEEEIQRLITHIDGNQNVSDNEQYLSNELTQWKEKFNLLNRDYHKTQETLLLTKAELESKQRRY